MTAPCTPFFNRSGGFGITGSPSAGWTFTKTAEVAVAEFVAQFGVSDAAGYLRIRNGSVVNSAFVADLVWHNSGNALSNRITSTGADTGSVPVHVWNFVTNTPSAFSTRPLLSLRNNDTEVLGAIPLNSGANSALSWGTQTGAAPAFTTRSAGTRLILYSAISGTKVDNAIGVSASGAANTYSVQEATSSYAHDFYAGTTKIAYLRGDGQLTTTGSKVDKLRVALTTPVTVVAGTDYIVVSNLTTPGAVAVNLPATPATGLTYVIKDGKGDAAANNITITPAAGNIDGAGTLVIAANYGRAVLVYNGTEWNVIT